MLVRTLQRALLLLSLLAVTGCEFDPSIAVNRHPASPSVQLRNVYRPPMDGRVVRVAVFPLAGDVQPPEALHEMDRTFLAEFNKTQMFEGIEVNRSEMVELTRREQFSSAEPIPSELIAALRQKYDVEAVLFIDITHYRPYRPIAMSVRTKLVSLGDQGVLWAIDSTFDSAEPGVAAAARKFGRVTDQNGITSLAADSSGVLLSPSRFARFVAREIFATLPGRLSRPR
jgi:hypothetical protein